MKYICGCKTDVKYERVRFNAQQYTESSPHLVDY